MIDTHTHIYGPEYDADRADVVARARAAGVSHIILPNVDLGTISQMEDCCNQFPDYCSRAMGLHPTEVKQTWQDDLLAIRRQLARGGYKAVGEVGMDLYWDRTFASEQEAALEQQVSWAVELDLPLILHIRKAHAETFRVLAKFPAERLRGVFHCFSGGIEEARKAVRMGFMLGIGGAFTYKNSGLPAIVREIGISHIVTETDAPYLAPVPFRGKRNEPAYMARVVELLAATTGCSAQETDEITTSNAREMFKI